jgi:hypothetical protein
MNLQSNTASLGQLGDIHRNPPRLVAGHQVSRRAPAGLILEIAAFYEINGARPAW